MKKILIIEDELQIAELEKDYLELSDFEVTIETDGTEGEKKAMSGEYDLLILDVMLPGENGFKICEKFREKYLTPVIMVSAKKEDSDKIHGLGLGADDYMTKPFSPSELVARVKAVLSRTMPKASESGDRFVFGKLSIDTASHTVHVAGKEVALTPKEFDLLVYLATNKGLALSREKILQNVWHYDYFVEDRTVDTHVKMLRSHLGECRGYITTVWGIGYKFDPNAEAE